MTVEELISSIADVGVLVCIAALFLYACFRAIKNYFDKKDKAIKPTKEDLVPAKPAREAHDAAMEVRNDVSIKIQEVLEQYQQKFNCDRLQVIEFGNSQLTLGYLPFKYMTCTYEVCKFGVRGIGNRIDKLSASLFTPFLQKLHEEDYVILDINEECRMINGVMHDCMIEFNEPRSLNAAIITPAGKFIGYVTAKNMESYSQEDIDNIVSLADNLAALLGVLDN